MKKLNCFKVAFSLLASVVLMSSNAQAQAKSVQFVIETDAATDKLMAGKEINIGYACSEAYDSLYIAAFGEQVEVLKESKINSTGICIVNGVQSKVTRIGVNYLVRFIKAGEYRMPEGRVIVEGKTYKTAPEVLSIKPANADTTGLRCYLSITPEQPQGGDFCQIRLICNRSPDSYSPILRVGESIAEISGRGTTIKNGVSEYEFTYHVRTSSGGGSWRLSVENLSFGGVPYVVEDQMLEVADVTPSTAWFWVLVVVLLAAWPVIIQRCFRNEKDADPVLFIRQYHRLNLNYSWADTHYGFPIAMCFLAAMIVGVVLYDYLFGSNAGVVFTIPVWAVAASILLIFLSFRNQRSKLDFESIRTSKSVTEIHAAIRKIAEQHHWIIDSMDENCVVAHTNRFFPSLSWGEQIFVVFDGRLVWINSVNDLNKRSVAFSFGYRKRNIRLLKEVIR